VRECVLDMYASGTSGYGIRACGVPDGALSRRGGGGQQTGRGRWTQRQGEGYDKPYKSRSELE